MFRSCPSCPGDVDVRSQAVTVDARQLYKCHTAGLHRRMYAVPTFHWELV